VWLAGWVEEEKKRRRSRISFEVDGESAPRPQHRAIGKREGISKILPMF